MSRNRKSCRVALRLDTGDPYFLFWALSRCDAAADVGGSLPRETYGARGYTTTDPSVGTVTRCKIALQARFACLRRSEKRFFSVRTIRRTRRTAMPVGIGGALAKKLAAGCGTLRPPRKSEKGHCSGPLQAP